MKEKKVMESDLNLESIFRAAPIGIGHVIDRVLVKANETLCNMLGYSESELLNQSARILYLSDSDFEYVGKEKYKQIAEKGIGTVETRWKCKDDKVIDILLSSSPIDLKDASKGFTFTAMDITRQKRAEQEQTQLQSQLFQAQKMESIGRLAGGVAHDFNNMLTIILGHTEYLICNLGENFNYRKDLDAIHTASLKSAEITNQLLAFARKQQVTAKTIEINEAVQNLLTMLQRLINENIEISFKRSDKPAFINIDPAQLSQILINLVLNAVDAIQKFGKIEIATETVIVDNKTDYKVPIPLGDYLLLTVKDTGVGIAEEFIGQIFEPFFSVKKSTPGTGLGLATVYGIVKQNSGFIDVKSKVHEGTEFLIFFPIVKCESKVTETIIKEPSVNQISTANILLVEDDESILLLCKTILEKKGYHITATVSPKQALEVAKTDHHIDLIITDVVMPEMNGKQLVDKISEIFPNIKVIYISGYTDEILTSKGLEKSDSNFLQKPFSPTKLVEYVNKLISST